MMTAHRHRWDWASTDLAALRCLDCGYAEDARLLRCPAAHLDRPPRLRGLPLLGHTWPTDAERNALIARILVEGICPACTSERLTPGAVVEGVALSQCACCGAAWQVRQVADGVQWRHVTRGRLVEASIDDLAEDYWRYGRSGA